MADVSQVSIGSTTYNVKDATARAAMIPTGGSSGQVLAKSSGSNYDCAWVNQSGGGGSVGLPFFQAVRTSGTTSLSASTITTVPLLSTNSSVVKSDDADDYFEFSGNGIKCKQAGTIEIDGGCYFQTATSSYSMGVYFKNGSTEVGSGAYQTGAGNSRSLNGIIIEVAAGDVITLCGRSSSANSVAANKSTYLSIKYLDKGSGGGGGGGSAWVDLSQEFTDAIEDATYSAIDVRAKTDGTITVFNAYIYSTGTLMDIELYGFVPSVCLPNAMCSITAVELNYAYCLNAVVNDSIIDLTSFNSQFSGESVDILLSGTWVCMGV